MQYIEYYEWEIFIEIFSKLSDFLGSVKIIYHIGRHVQSFLEFTKLHNFKVFVFVLYKNKKEL